LKRKNDLYRVNFEVTNLKTFLYLAFPHVLALENMEKTRAIHGANTAYNGSSFGLKGTLRRVSEDL